MDFKQIQELIKLVNKTNVSEIKVEEKDFKISIRTKSYTEAINQPTTVPVLSQAMPAINPAVVSTGANVEATPVATEQKPIEAEKEKSNLIEVKSPMIGTFYRSSSPDKPPFIKVGDTIETGSILCIVEAMKLFNEIESEVSGTIVKILIDNASPVEYDTPLFLVEPA